MRDGRVPMRVDAVLIAGPTASGKSAVAVRLARTFGGTVVNADSMQVYRDLRILTNRPNSDEEASAPHRLFGEVDGAETFSAARYATAAAEVASALDRDEGRPIFVGGTGLYFKALTEGLSDIPAVPQGIRERVRAGSEGVGTDVLHAELARRDPETAGRLKPGDRQRILRALEVLAATDRPVSAFQGNRVPGPLAGRHLRRVFLLPPDRADLRARIDRRFEAMIRGGALAEVRALAARDLDPALPVMRAHGVPGLVAHLRGEIGLDEAIRRGQADTRAYAKRQLTWFRHQMPDFEAVDPDDAYDRVARSLTDPRDAGSPAR